MATHKAPVKSSKKVPAVPAKVAKTAARVMSAASHRGDKTTPARAAADRKAIQAVTKATTKTAPTKKAVSTRDKVVQSVGKSLQAAGAHIVGGKAVQKGLIKANPPKAAAPAKKTAVVNLGGGVNVRLPKAAASKPPAKAVKKSGPQLKSVVVVETRPVVDGTSEKAQEQVVVQKPLVDSTSHRIAHRQFLSDLSGTSSRTAAPAPALATAQLVQSPTSEKVAVVVEPQHTGHHAQYQGSGLQRHNVAEHELKEAHSIMHPVATPAPAPVATPTPQKPRTEWRSQPGAANGGLKRDFTLPHGVLTLASATAESIAADADLQTRVSNNLERRLAASGVLETDGRAPDGHPATSENTGAETPAQPQWKTAIAGGTQGGFRSSLAKGETTPRLGAAASTGHAPGLIERRFEVYQEGPAAYRWRLMNATTGVQIALSQGQPFGTADQAEAGAHQESRLYKPGTSLVTRASGAGRF